MFIDANSLTDMCFRKFPCFQAQTIRIPWFHSDITIDGSLKTHHMFMTISQIHENLSKDWFWTHQKNDEIENSITNPSWPIPKSHENPLGLHLQQGPRPKSGGSSPSRSEGESGERSPRTPGFHRRMAVRREFWEHHRKTVGKYGKWSFTPAPSSKHTYMATENGPLIGDLPMKIAIFHG